MHYPEELCKLRLRDVKFSKNICWIHVVLSKPNQFANRIFISIECIDSSYCPVRLLKKYLLVRPRTSDEQPLFPSKQGGKLSVGAVGAIVKRITENANLQRRYTAYSIRISSATAVISAGLSLIQIYTIEEWDSKAVVLYLRSVGMSSLCISRRIGLA
ncbi:22533_t:CDS:1, partial [Gigaspora margarita]